MKGSYHLSPSKRIFRNTLPCMRQTSQETKILRGFERGDLKVSMVKGCPKRRYCQKFVWELQSKGREHLQERINWS
jgi:hypothetical protein